MAEEIKDLKKQLAIMSLSLVGFILFRILELAQVFEDGLDMIFAYEIQILVVQLIPISFKMAQHFESFSSMQTFYQGNNNDRISVSSRGVTPREGTIVVDFMQETTDMSNAQSMSIHTNAIAALDDTRKGDVGTEQSMQTPHPDESLKRGIFNNTHHTVQHDKTNMENVRFEDSED